MTPTPVLIVFVFTRNCVIILTFHARFLVFFCYVSCVFVNNNNCYSYFGCFCFCLYVFFVNDHPSCMPYFVEGLFN